ncbi:MULTISPECIES: hypothetical protein [Brevibacillus]|jgi:hypothetical protein|uniref:Uncharacterized protein n=1 Tax=Brevibacillus borstelensis AK1 TaxID=1300222 RepID=M8DBZ0_9BACL|nr:hypothetical protein [Brevibacillus borstelensis]EMT53814.1 hypothetical protein I532_07360 [Brevibacillus borstelensis AK1]KKX56784.1 hypothetical protein X546_02085 [Brevibacillus borstelensis cifa_chp40]MBE5395748.1 hypothetical protein [Brevibacillus borstelensis]MCC0566328.1 hypothetical protein [Brevibacillus borstelensis]MCM3473422.1 hypothetical protein [Brevibacillus borstelensis]
MKRVTFASAQELKEYCLEQELSLVVEYRDDQNKQRQVILSGERLEEAGMYLDRPKAEAYFRKDGVFHEVIAGWQDGG